MNNGINNWKKETKQKLRYWFWHQKVKAHRLIDKIHTWCRDKIINLLIKTENWCHKKLDELWDKLMTKAAMDEEDEFDDFEPIEGDTLG